MYNRILSSTKKIIQSEMKLYVDFNTMARKQHFGKKLLELEEERRAVQVIKSNENIITHCHLSLSN